jgi:hypothetical protein
MLENVKTKLAIIKNISIDRLLSVEQQQQPLSIPKINVGIFIYSIQIE